MKVYKVVDAGTLVSPWMKGSGLAVEYRPGTPATPRPGAKPLFCFRTRDQARAWADSMHLYHVSIFRAEAVVSQDTGTITTVKKMAGGEEKRTYWYGDCMVPEGTVLCNSVTLEQERADIGSPR